MVTSHPASTATTLGSLAIRTQRSQARDRQGSVTVLSLALTTVLVAVLAITLDLGYIAVSHAELRRTADASAMAACWELYDQQNESTNVSETSVLYAAMETASLNLVSQQSPTIGTSLNDFAIGYYDTRDGGSFSSNSSNPSNAVRVRIARHSLVNGELPLFFGAITGRSSQSIDNYAVAAMLNNISGFHLPATDSITVEILPMALDLETWEAVVAGQTTDKFRCENGTVSNGSDGKYECNLYPQGTGSPGNRGTVDIGGANNSTADLSRQILDGISRQDFIDLGKPLAFDSNGVLELNGDTGISAGIKDELASIIGQKRIIPIYENVTGNGNNATYRIVRFEGVQILDVKLTGPKNGKRVTVQPAKMVARQTILSTSESHSSDFLVTPVMLVE
jgi:Flp pilus assembly protein TadG